MNPCLAGFLSVSSPSGLPLIILQIVCTVFPSISKCCPEHLLFLCILFSSGTIHACGLNIYFFLVAPSFLDPSLIPLFPVLQCHLPNFSSLQTWLLMSPKKFCNSQKMWHFYQKLGCSPDTAEAGNLESSLGICPSPLLSL